MGRVRGRLRLMRLTVGVSVAWTLGREQLGRSRVAFEHPPLVEVVRVVMVTVEAMVVTVRNSQVVRACHMAGVRRWE
jgi:hypothetical protein